MQTNEESIATVSWRRRASVWLGIGINPASISVGGGLAARLALSELIWILPLGALLLTVLCAGQGYIGYRRRERLSQIASSTFGSKWGAGLLNLLMAIGMVGWGGFQGGVSGASAAQLFHLPGWAGALLMVGVLFVFSELGVNRWAALAWVTTGAAIALTIFALLAVDLTPTVDVTSPMVNSGSGPPMLSLFLPWIWVMGTTVSYATLFSLRNPDFTWDMASASDLFKANLFLFFPLLFGMSAGVLLYRATGNWNIADVLTQAQSASLGHIFLMVSVISPLISGWYSGALALSSLTSLTPRQGTILISSFSFILAATRFDQLFLPFLGVLGASLTPALITILVVHLLPSRPQAAEALTAWLVGATVAILFQLQGQSIHVFAGAMASIITLLILQVVSYFRLT
ncbi:MAG: hypothetical protein AAF702_50685 [Chloroflexota bacterium]